MELSTLNEELQKMLDEVSFQNVDDVMLVIYREDQIGNLQQIEVLNPKSTSVYSRSQLSGSLPIVVSNVTTPPKSRPKRCPRCAEQRTFNHFEKGLSSHYVLNMQKRQHIYLSTQYHFHCSILINT